MSWVLASHVHLPPCNVLAPFSYNFPRQTYYAALFLLLYKHNSSRSQFALFCKMCFQGSLDARRKRGLIAGAVFGYAQAVMFWVFALMFFIGAVLVDDGTVEYLDFFTSMFAVIFGAFGVGLV